MGIFSIAKNGSEFSTAKIFCSKFSAIIVKFFGQNLILLKFFKPKFTVGILV